ncbi:MAG TPA: S1 domain-containing post-transcriptional regulator GSP13 [Cerasibacillus sp.]|uniref:S1 domain-containing post-transcriptional regulator GSP13 n=1 Tax=Cerasibacillus sp. TaxID=2498711 RepID=UPI002F3FCB32
MNERHLEVGQVLQGKVTGVQPYGAFVAITDKVQGLVHISEITHGYVKDINDHLAVDDEVKVKIIDLDDESGKVSLSIRATEEPPKKQPKQNQSQIISKQDSPSEGFNTLKYKLQDWIKQTEERKQTYKN